MPKTDILKALAEYTTALSDALDKDTHPINRPQYLRHLAWCAKVFAKAYNGAQTDELEPYLRTENRTFGWQHFEGSYKKKLFDAWKRFKKKIDYRDEES